MEEEELRRNSSSLTENSKTMITDLKLKMPVQAAVAATLVLSIFISFAILGREGLGAVLFVIGYFFYWLIICCYEKYPLKESQFKEGLTDSIDYDTFSLKNIISLSKQTSEKDIWSFYPEVIERYVNEEEQLKVIMVLFGYFYAEGPIEGVYIDQVIQKKLQFRAKPSPYPFPTQEMIDKMLEEKRGETELLFIRFNFLIENYSQLQEDILDRQVFEMKKEFLLKVMHKTNQRAQQMKEDPYYDEESINRITQMGTHVFSNKNSENFEIQKKQIEKLMDLTNAHYLFQSKFSLDRHHDSFLFKKMANRLEWRVERGQCSVDWILIFMVAFAIFGLILLSYLLCYFYARRGKRLNVRFYYVKQHQMMEQSRLEESQIRIAA